MKSSFPLRRVRSFVRRDGRMTDGQKRAFEVVWPRVGLEIKNGLLTLAADKKYILEIGFGSGYSLLEMAKSHPEQNFIAIETHKPGVGTLMAEMEVHQVNNIQIYYADAVEVLKECIPDASMDVIQLFFPDPWPKRKHHKRRLIQSEFVELIATKLKPNGALHLATDWQHYAEHMMKVLTGSSLKNSVGEGEYSNRSAHRPVITKFELRGQQSGRAIWELQFVK
jgi:tRNA (guanine-N7-)-methyltransferase